MTEEDKEFVEDVREKYLSGRGIPNLDAVWLFKIIDEQEIEINRLERELGREVKHE